MAVTWEDLIAAVIFNGVAAIVCFIAFNFLRRLSFVRNFYAPKRKLKIPFRFRPPRLSNSLLGWMKPVFAMPDEEFVAIAGFDALTLVRFLGLCIRISALASILGVAILLPVNLTSDAVGDIMVAQTRAGCMEEEDDDSGVMADGSNVEQTTGVCGTIVTTFDETSLTNVSSSPTNNVRFWAHTLVMIIFALGILHMLKQHWMQALKWRILYFSRTRKGGAGHTILVTDIPGTFDGTVVGCIPGLGKMFSKAKDAVPEGDDALFVDDNHDVYKHHTQPASKLANEDVTAGGRGEEYRDAQDRTPSSGEQAAMTNKAHPPPRNIKDRLDLAFYESRSAPTDFETWEQAEEAVQGSLTVEDVVRREFSRNFGSREIHAVSVVKNVGKLDKLVAEYNKKKCALLDLADGWLGSLRKQKAPKRKEVTYKPDKDNASMLKQWGSEKKKVDQMEYSQWELDDLLRRIREEQANVQNNESGSAFVTLRDRLTQSVTTTGLLSYDEDYWQTEQAPPPNDVIWENVKLRSWERTLRNLVTWALFGLMIFFFIPIVAAIQQIINLQKYRSPGNWADTILTLPVAGPIIVGVLPTLALTIFLALVPKILAMFASKIAKLPTESAVQFDVGRKFFMFQFLVVFIFNTLLGALSSASGDSNNPVKTLSDEIFSRPFTGDNSIIDWVGSAVPQQANFFMLYLLTKGLLSQSISFLKIPGAIISFILGKISGSPRQQKRTWSQQYINYGIAVPNHSIALLLVIVFAVIQPFVSIAGLFYFIVAYFAARYDLLYRWREPYQSGGLYWPVIFNQILTGFFTFLILMLALFGIKKFAYGSPIALILILLTIIFVKKVHAKYARPMTSVSIHAAADLDRSDQTWDWMKDLTPGEEKTMVEKKWDLEDTEVGPIEDRYVQPALKVLDIEHRVAIENARSADDLVRQFNAGSSVADADALQTVLESDDESDGEFYGKAHDKV